MAPAAPEANASPSVQSLADLEELILRFYAPGSSKEISGINDALQRYQRSPEGWQLADALLQSKEPNVRFFGALTFTVKINQDWGSLSDSDASALLYKIIEWFVRSTQNGEIALVVRKLCSALIAYYLRPAGSWKTCIRHLLLSLKEGNSIPLDLIDNYPFHTSSLVDTLDDDQVKAVLWFATGLVEEVNKTDATSIQTNNYFERVSSNLDDVIGLLRYSICSAHRDASLAVEGVKCFRAWIIYAQRGWVDKGRELASLRSLTPLVMDALQYEEMYDTVSEFLRDILEEYPPFLTDSDKNSLATFLTTADAQNMVTRLIEGDIDDDTENHARLLLAFGDATVPELAKSTSSNELSLINAQLLGLLRCDGYSEIEYRIISYALEYWMTYAEVAIDALSEDEEQLPAWVETAKERIERVIETCWVNISSPSSSIAAGGRSVEAEINYQTFRKDVQDIVQSSYVLLGLHLFERLVDMALEALRIRAWLPLETTLFCLSSLSDTINYDDATNATLSQLFVSPFFAEMTSAEESITPSTRQAAVHMISRYTDFFESYPDYLPTVLNFLFESLKSPILVNVAAKAISSICFSCRKSLTSELNAFMQQFETFSKWELFDKHAKEKLIEAIAAIIEAMPTDEDKLGPLTALIQSIEKDASNGVTGLSSPDREGAEDECVSALKCLLGMGKALQSPDEVVIDLEVDDNSLSTFWMEGPGSPLQTRVIKMLKTLTALMNWNSEIIEAACQILRVGYKERTPGLFVLPLQVTIEFVLASGLNTARLDYILDSAGILLISHSKHAEKTLHSAASPFVGYILGLIGSMNGDPSADPEVSTSILSLANTMISLYINTLITTSTVENLFDFSTRALTVAEIMPKRSAMKFWATLTEKRDENAADYLRNVMNTYGPLVCRILVWKIGGEAARSELEELAEPLKKMVFYQPRAKTWLASALDNPEFPSQKVSSSEKRTWLQRIMHLRGAKGTYQAIKDFWIQCRGTEFAYTS